MKSLLTLSIVTLFAGCAGHGERATVADTCQKDDGTLVMVEGFLRPPNFMRADRNPESELTTYELLLVEGLDDSGPTIRTSVFGTSGKHTNRIAELSPEGFTQSDLQIFTDTGEVAGSRDRLRITGKLSKDQREQRGQPCVLKIERIEKP